MKHIRARLLGMSKCLYVRKYAVLLTQMVKSQMSVASFVSNSSREVMTRRGEDDVDEAFMPQASGSTERRFGLFQRLGSD